MTKLADDEISKALEHLEGWRFSDGRISKTFNFRDFTGSVEFVNRIVPIANSMNHHPDLCIFYDRVEVTLTTHDEGGVTEKDIKLAEEIEKLFQ